jgi:hypothetical protein
MDFVVIMDFPADWNLELWFNQISGQDRIERQHGPEPLGVLMQRELQFAQNAIQLLRVVCRDCLKTQFPDPVLKRQGHGGPATILT